MHVRELRNPAREPGSAAFGSGGGTVAEASQDPEFHAWQSWLPGVHRQSHPASGHAVLSPGHTSSSNPRAEMHFPSGSRPRLPRRQPSCPKRNSTANSRRYSTAGSRSAGTLIATSLAFAAFGRSSFAGATTSLTVSTGHGALRNTAFRDASHEQGRGWFEALRLDSSAGRISDRTGSHSASIALI